MNTKNISFQASIDQGQGGTTMIKASDIAAAVEKATEWAQAGEWRQDGSVSVRVWGTVEGQLVEQTVDVAVKKSEIFA